MNGGNVNDFLDHTTYEECAIRYKGTKYFFHGIIFNKEKNEYSYDIDIWSSNGCFEKNVFSKTFSSAEKYLESDQSEPIFDGKTFWEAESEMEWIDW